jgi:hypothetical protein
VNEHHSPPARHPHEPERALHDTHPNAYPNRVMSAPIRRCPPGCPPPTDLHRHTRTDLRSPTVVYPSVIQAGASMLRSVGRHSCSRATSGSRAPSSAHWRLRLRSDLYAAGLAQAMFQLTQTLVLSYTYGANEVVSPSIDTTGPDIVVALHVRQGGGSAPAIGLVGETRFAVYGAQKTVRYPGGDALDCSAS